MLSYIRHLWTYLVQQFKTKTQCDDLVREIYDYYWSEQIEFGNFGEYLIFPIQDPICLKVKPVYQDNEYKVILQLSKHDDSIIFPELNYPYSGKIIPSENICTFLDQELPKLQRIFKPMPMK